MNRWFYTCCFMPYPAVIRFTLPCAPNTPHNSCSVRRVSFYWPQLQNPMQMLHRVMRVARLPRFSRFHNRHLSSYDRFICRMLNSQQWPISVSFLGFVHQYLCHALFQDREEGFSRRATCFTSEASCLNTKEEGLANIERIFASPRKNLELGPSSGPLVF